MTNALQDLEALNDGLSSAFWAVLSKHITQEWGPSGVAFQQMYQQGIAAKDWEKVVAANEIQKAMAILLQWPHERAQQLKGQGLKELVEMRARGGV